jgi:hypothetical protein
MLKIKKKVRLPDQLRVIKIEKTAVESTKEEKNGTSNNAGR